MVWRKGEVIAGQAFVGDALWWADPYLVIDDTEEYSALYIGPGAVSRCPAAMASSQGHGPDPAHRWKVASSGKWELVERAWKDTHALTFLYPGKYFAVRLFWSEKDHSFLCWYVNYQRPFERNDKGFVAFDLELDIYILPGDRKRHVKDKPQFDAGVALGAITAEDVEGIRAAESELSQLFQLAVEPFVTDWSRWQPPELSEPLVLPAGL